MIEVNKSLDRISWRTVLVFPPEAILGGKYFCRFEPDGIALIKGYLKERGYRYVDLVYSSFDCGFINEWKTLLNPFGWAISPIDKEGLSMRSIVNSALSQRLDTLNALSLKTLLPLDTIQNTGIIGFSIGFPSQLYHALILARIAKELNPKIFVVIGGALITSYITFVVTLTDILNVVDGIIGGYGEEPLAQLILCIEEKGDLGRIPNLYLSTAGGFMHNIVSWKPNKNSLLTIPDYGRSSLQRNFDQFFPVRPSIGCYWGKCSFCVYPSMSTGTSVKRPYIVLTPEELVEYLRCLMINGSGNKFELCSDSLSPYYLKHFSEHILKSKLNIKWSAWSCVDKSFLDYGVLDMMKHSGCVSILVGVESSCQRTLTRINKMQDKCDIDNVLRAFSLVDIGLFLTLCIGFPGETYEEAMETIEYLQGIIEVGGSVQRKDIRIYRFALMCNTPIVNNYKDYCISSVDFSDMYYLDDDFTYHYEVTEGMNFMETKDFVIKWRALLGIQTNDSPEIRILD